MYYIQENDKLKMLEKLFSVVKIEDDNIIMPLKNNEFNDKTAYKLSQKTRKILNKTNCNKIILSKKIKEQELYVNYLYSYNYQIVDGKRLFKMLIFDVLEYVVNYQKKGVDKTKIVIMVNDISEYTIYVITKLIEKYKYIKIVTNHIEKLRKIERKIFEEKGIMISIGNNKRKALSNADIILNIDFPTELINRYNINSEAIIVNFNRKVIIKDKRFNGINIKDYEITWANCSINKKMDKFYTKDIYEAEHNFNIPIKDVLDKLKRDKVKIKKLIAQNMEI